jgi:hypothetical protein
MPVHSISDPSLTRATEITKAAFGTGGTGGWINSPDLVAKFIETVAVKLEQLREGEPPPQR